MTEVKDADRSVGTAFQVGQYVFKQAQTPAEIAQLNELNYRTFVQEIPQHEDNGLGSLEDKFHSKNTYFMALCESRVVGMISVHGEPPFSIADKLIDPSVLAELGDRPLEVRLLAVEPSLRNGAVFIGLGYIVYDYACRHGYTHMLISGVKEQLSLYNHLGFQQIGPGVQNGGAHFVPMAVSLDAMPAGIRRDAERYRKRVHPAFQNGAAGRSSNSPAIQTARGARSRTPLLLLPGPVTFSGGVTRALARPSLYHRGREFKELFRRIRTTLAKMTGKPVAIFTGSGTLANEVVAATLKADRTLKKGAVLVTGEFGRRLAGQAQRVGLSFEIIERPWGDAWPLEELKSRVDEDTEINWVWATHIETSTGRVNDLDGLLSIVRTRGLKLCLDCVSSIGALPVDLTEVYIGTGASGKALASKAGVSFVFAESKELKGVDSDSTPAYLDLVETLNTPGPRFTFGSQDLVALDEALRAYSTPELRKFRFQMYSELGRYVRRRLNDMGVPTVAPESDSAPIITTIVPPCGLSVTEFVETCRDWGVLVGGEGRYLQERGWAQIATMGDLTREDCEIFLSRLESWLRG